MKVEKRDKGKLCWGYRYSAAGECLDMRQVASHTKFDSVVPRDGRAERDDFDEALVPLAAHFAEPSCCYKIRKPRQDHQEAPDLQHEVFQLMWD